ncbi:MAG: amino acid permease, partial [Legionella sp.]|nr:amino acid permease [Legionella sp.]
MAQKKHALTLFSLTMITVGSVDSIRNLPATALFGSQLIAFFILGAICFLIPTALVSAELASGWPKQGGVYVWVKEAFGQRAGFLAIWLQWIENVIWYPTMLA